MTNKEAANRLARIFNKYCNTHDEDNRCDHECNLCNRCKDCYDREAYDMAIKALEKAEQYRWHDLRKNPKDLPDDNACAYDWYECVHENHENELCRPYYQFNCGEFGYWRDYYHPVSLGFVDSEFDTIDDMKLEKVIAWKEIEPFEEEE